MFENDFELSIAGPADDPALRALLRENPMPGKISLTLQREPDFFLGATIDGDQHETLICRDPGERTPAGMGTRSARDVWLNGEVGRLGYLSQLRVDRRFRGIGGGLLMWQMFRYLEEHIDPRETPFHITTIFEDNAPARRLLEKRGRHAPTYLRTGTLCSLALPLWRRQPVANGSRFEVRRASAEHLPDIAACLQRNYAAFQFAPVWRAEDLDDPDVVRGLRPQDFRVALVRGRVAGCLAVWDQQGFKQTVVHGYPRGGLWRLRHLANLAAPLGGWPRFPAPGQPLRHVFASHVAVDDADPEIFRALLCAAYNGTLGQGHAYLMLGLAEGHPLLSVARSALRHIESRVAIYLVYWAHGAPAVARLDGRPRHVELALM